MKGFAKGLALGLALVAAIAVGQGARYPSGTDFQIYDGNGGTFIDCNQGFEYDCTLQNAGDGSLTLTSSASGTGTSINGNNVTIGTNVTNGDINITPNTGGDINLNGTTEVLISSGSSNVVSLQFAPDAAHHIGVNRTSGFEFEGATADGFETTITIADPGADRTITLPDATGTILLDTTATGASIDYMIFPQTGALTGTAGTGALTGVDVVNFQRFSNPYSVSVTQLTYHVTSGVAAGADCGMAIYNAAGTSSLGECSNNTSAVGTYVCDIPDFTLTSGEYLLAWSCNNNQGGREINIGTFNSIFSDSSPALWGTCSNTAGADSDMPATCGTLTHDDTIDLLVSVAK